MKLKVCGMRDAGNIQDIASLGPNYLGFIFYPKSSRYVGLGFDAALMDKIPQNIEKVGVFVNEPIDLVITAMDRYGLDYAQLHGDETVAICEQLFLKGFKVIKAFSLDSQFDFRLLENYKPFVSYFLFDTKGKNYGGNGVVFDWSVLDDYDNEVPFFLSGGLSLENAESVASLSKHNIHALDINSKFEVSPAFKNVEKVKCFKEKIIQVGI